VKFWILIPARDEEQYINKCIDSIEQAAAGFVPEV
jgi:hypothetical protein